MIGGEGGAGDAKFADAERGLRGVVEEGGAGGGGQGGEVAVVGVKVGGELEAWGGLVACLGEGGGRRYTFVVGRVRGGDVGVIFR